MKLFTLTLLAVGLLTTLVLAATIPPEIDENTTPVVRSDGLFPPPIGNRICGQMCNERKDCGGDCRVCKNYPGGICTK